MSIKGGDEVVRYEVDCSMLTLYNVVSKTVVLKVWSLDQHHHQSPGNSLEMKFSWRHHRPN